MHFKVEKPVNAHLERSKLLPLTMNPFKNVPFFIGLRQILTFLLSQNKISMHSYVHYCFLPLFSADLTIDVYSYQMCSVHYHYQYYCCSSSYFRHFTHLAIQSNFDKQYIKIDDVKVKKKNNDLEKKYIKIFMIQN